MMELANWAEWAGTGAALAAVALLVWWLRKKILPLISIAGISFYDGDLKTLSFFRDCIARAGRDPDFFLGLHESEILEAVASLGNYFALLNALIDKCTPLRALSYGILVICPKLVKASVSRPGITPQYIESAMSENPPDWAMKILIEMWEALTGKKWKDGPDWPPSRDDGHGPSGPAPGHGGSPEPTR